MINRIQRLIALPGSSLKTECLVFLGLLILFFSGCQDPVMVKPAGKLRLDFPKATYANLESLCHYNFEVNQGAQIQQKPNCAFNIHYPFMEATIYVTHQEIDRDLPQLLSDAQKLTYDHSIKASQILEQPRVDGDHRVYGMYYAIDGDAASQAQFYLTDSTRHFLTGALYFNTKPNFDSLYPAIDYVRRDIRHLMETLRWE